MTRTSIPGLHRSAGSRRSRAVRAQRLSGRGVDAAARRGAGRVLRAARLPAVLGDHEARRHRRGGVAAGGVLERARAHPGSDRRAGPADGDGRHARSAAARPPAPGRDAALHAARHSVAPRRDRTHRGRDRSTRWRPRTTRASSTSWSASPRRSRSRVISWILGVPRSDWQLLFHWTNEVIGKDDPEFRRPGETPGQTIKRARGELHAYLGELIEAAPAGPGRRHRQPPAQRGDRRRSRSPSCSSSRTAS